MLFFNENGGPKIENIISSNLIQTNDILELKRKVKLAKGQEKVDLVVKNANILNVFSGDIHETDVAIADGIFVGFGEGYVAKNTYDARGKFMCPGLIDGHIHLESTFLSPIEFCNVVALHGTSAVICDPHEIANVLGLRGIDYFLQTSHGLPVKIYLMMPSCVPATSMETSGAKILDKDISDYVHRYSDRIIGLGEMMNYPGVLSEDEEVLSKLLAVRYRPKDGHAPLLSGKSLNAYIVAGLESDHECSKLAEALEKLRKGMHIMIREGTQEKNLQALVPLINEFNSFKLLTNFPLPIAGLMSDKPIESVIANLRKVNEVCKNLGNNVIRDPFMLLSFLSLSVIPSLKLTDKGLLDTERFQLTNLWVQY